MIALSPIIDPIFNSFLKLSVIYRGPTPSAFTVARPPQQPPPIAGLTLRSSFCIWFFIGWGRLGLGAASAAAQYVVTHSQTSHNPINLDFLLDPLSKSEFLSFGVPKEIIVDHGSDLKKGIEIFCRQHPQTCFIYDIKHKVAAILKRELKDDQDWNEFVKLANETRRKVQQTSLAALAPPNQRSKSRYMNVDKLIKWAMQTLYFLDQQQLSANEHFDPQQIEAKLSWLVEFRHQLLEWQEVMQIVKLAESFIKFNGLYRDCHLDLMQVEGFYAHRRRTKRLREELLDFIAQQSDQAKPSERLLGSSEVIESVIGKLKNIEADQNKSGFTGLLLSLAAIVSKTTEDVIHKAMESVPTKRVHQWVKENLGKSVQSKRKEVFSSAKKTEQKWDEIQWVFE